MVDQKLLEEIIKSFLVYWGNNPEAPCYYRFDDLNRALLGKTSVRGYPEYYMWISSNIRKTLHLSKNVGWTGLNPTNRSSPEFDFSSPEEIIRIIKGEEEW